MKLTSHGWALGAAVVGTAVATWTTCLAQDINTEIKQRQRELDSTRRQITEVQTHLSGLEVKEKASLERLHSLEEQIRLVRHYLDQLRVQAAARTAEIAAVSGEIRAASEKAQARQRDLAGRLLWMYKYGRVAELEALFSMRSLPGVYRRVLYLRWLAKSDRRLVDELNALKQHMDSQRSRLIAAHAELERLRGEQTTQQAALSSSEAHELRLLQQLRSERESRQELASQLETAAGQLQAVISDLERRRREQAAQAGNPLQARRGRLLWPIRGRVIATFGAQVHPKYKTRTNNLGIDIKVESDSTAKAVAPGKVAYADQFMGYGSLVIVEHGGGLYSLYSNLDEMRVSVGTAVEEGGVVGVCRDYLHFEIRVDGKPVDPVDWLRTPGGG